MLAFLFTFQTQEIILTDNYLLYIYIYIYVVKLATVVEGDQKAPF